MHPRPRSRVKPFLFVFGLLFRLRRLLLNRAKKLEQGIILHSFRRPRKRLIDFTSEYRVYAGNCSPGKLVTWLAVRRKDTGISRQYTSGWVVFVFLVAATTILSPRLRAQAIIAPGGRTLFNRESLIRSFVGARHLSLRTPDGRTVDISQYIAPLAFVYAFHPKWQVIVVQPYVTTDITTRAGNQSRREDLNGFADSQLIIQYDGLYSRNAPGGLTRLSGVFSLQVPTGASRFSANAVQYTGGLIFEKVAKLKYAFTADFEYTVATANEDGRSVGNVATFDAVPAYFIIPREPPPPDATWLRKAFYRTFRNGAYAILEFNGTSQARAFARGTGEISNTGGTTLSISPGIQYFVSRRFLVEFSAPIPAVKDLNGIQPRPDSAFLLGFRWLF